MKLFNYISAIVFLTLLSISLQGQGQMVLEKGVVSFVSSRNIYVKFASTKGIAVGDTLFITKNEHLLPALVVNNKSSTSTVCTSLTQEQIALKDEIFAKVIGKKEQPETEKEPKKEEVPAPTPDKEEKANTDKPAATVITPDEDKEDYLFKEKTSGRISVASYSNLSDYRNTHRMRYAFNYRGHNLKNSRFSTESYITFRHTIGEWEEVQDNFSRALKVYALSVSYDFDSTSNLTLGRKINPRMSSIGAIDGCQYEKGVGKFILGAIAGSRPDYSDYGVNLSLLQVGAYASYVSKIPGKYRQSTFGFIEQHNKAETDRRFVYFQHSGELVKNLNLFSSFEVDLYEKINGEAQSTVQLTNLYLSLRYRATRNLRLSASYDNRKNIIYYESYKNFIDQLIDDETRQGIRLGISYRPFKFVTWGVNTGWRFQKSNANVSKNLNTYLNFARIPVVNIRASLTANILETNYIKSQVFGTRFSKELIKRILSTELYFRMVNYQYKSSENKVHQNIAGTSFSLRILKKLTLYLYYEGTFDDRNQAYHRFNTRLIQRF